MFDAVLQKIPAQKRFGTSTVLTATVHGGIIALVAFLTSRPPAPVEVTPPAIVFKRAAARPAARGTPNPAPQPHSAAPTKPRRPNAILPPRTVPTQTPLAAAEPVAAEPVVGAMVGEGDTLGLPDGVPDGDPSATGTDPQGTDPTGDECTPDCAFGAGMTRPVVPAGAFAHVYSRSALEAQVEGLMIVKCRVAVDGEVKNCRVLKGLPFLSEAVLERLATVRATPSYVEGRAVPVDYVFNFSFKLPH